MLDGPRLAALRKFFLPAEDRPSAQRSGCVPLIHDKSLERRPGYDPFKLTRLVIEPLYCLQFFLAAKRGFLNRGFQNPDRLVVHFDRNGIRMPILAAMRERKARRIAEAIRCSMNDLGHHCQRLHSARADARSQQQFGKIDRPSLGSRRQRSMQAPDEYVALPHVMMLWHDQMRKKRLLVQLLRQSRIFAENAIRTYVGQ